MSKTFDVTMRVTTQEDVEAEVVQNDIRDYVSGSFDGVDWNALPSYGMDVVEIEVAEA